MGAGHSSSTTSSCCLGLLLAHHGGASSTASPEPVCVAVSGGAGQIGYSLLPMIASGGMLGRAQKVILHCLDLNIHAVKENMRGMQMELQDGNFPLLHSVVFSTNEAVVFKKADYVILLGAFPQQEGKSRRETLEKNVLIFRTLGRAIQEHAKRTCKVLVVGNPSNTNAMICAQHAPLIPKEHFFALSRLDQNRASGIIARRAAATVGDVRNIIMWGVQAKSPDIDHCMVKGRPLGEVFSKPHDQQWLNGQFFQELLQHGESTSKARRARLAVSIAAAVVDHVHNLHAGTKPGEFVSMGVCSDGNDYNIANGLVFSMPVTCSGRGHYRVVSGLKVGSASKQKMLEIEAELVAERELTKEIISKRSAVPT
mmetsp:Transcript_52092/g.121135  ORF Transcript_52092/g.121135 Transcript_52092/m.121135 type:complete len:369 (-) Transcript_52092:118-1224(-)